MRDIVFWGAAGHAKVLHEALDGLGLRLVALIDNRILPPILGVPILHGEVGLDFWLERRDCSFDLYSAVAVGGIRGKERLALLTCMEVRGISPASIFHRNAFIAGDAILGEGCQVLAQASVCTYAELGRGVIVNTAASVDHECKVGDGVHIGPGARLAGEVSIEDCAFIGTGAIVLPRLRIGHDAVVGAGAVVTKDVPAGATVIGNPARPVN